MHTLSSLRAGKLSGAKRIDLCCGLSEFPDEIFDLADSLEILNLSGNALSGLPDNFPTLKKLRVIFCSDNRFTELPEILGQCPQLEIVGFKANKISKISAKALPEKLRWLILTSNQISELPAELGSRLRLQKLMLSGNQLQDLPGRMADCSRLELLRISANRFTQLPDWLISLPRLAWLAYSGNPCSDGSEEAAMAKYPVIHVEWSSLKLEAHLGEGASGVIYRASRLLSGKASNVAVKMFKGAMTSDGLPRSEKAAYITAGAHSGLIPIEGKVVGHPENMTGMVMTLIDPGFTNLAGPPSLDSCTRDVYRIEARFSLEVALMILLRIATVAEHLHARGIMHGDLYAHNILLNEQGECLLGDFGAATFFSPDDSHWAASMQRIEVRAFGCLMEELLERSDDQCDTRHTIINALHSLHIRCDQPEVNARPLFSEIRTVLITLIDTLQKC